MVSVGARAAGRQTGYDGERSAADLRWRTVRRWSDVRSAEKRATKHCAQWIGGKPWAGEASRRGDIYNPATGQVTGTVDFASAAEVGAAVEAAAGAWPAWRETSLTKRANVLFAFRELIRSRQAELAGLISSEHGKVAADAAGEVARGLEVVEFACRLPPLLKGGFSKNVSTGADPYSLRQPLALTAP